MVLAKNCPFFLLFILGNIGEKNVFYDNLDRKNGFLTYKRKKLKKLAILPTFYFMEYRPKQCVYDIIERKNGFLIYKNKKFKQSKK